MKNECGKMRPVGDPYEIWVSADGTWTWHVLKKWQNPEKEAANQYARWFCAVKSPPNTTKWWFGDVCIKHIKDHARQTKWAEGVER